jgi:hypothetical protein
MRLVAKKLIEVSPGEVRAIPLFVSDQSPIIRFSKKDFKDAGADFCFARVISDEGGSGLIIEVFDFVGGLDASIDEIVAAPRLFCPCVITSLPMYKKRWPLLGAHRGYDREKDSQFSKIEIVLDAYDPPMLWRGGEKTGVSGAAIDNYEPWVMWGSHQVEKRIIAALKESGAR